MSGEIVAEPAVATVTEEQAKAMLDLCTRALIDDACSALVAARHIKEFIDSGAPVLLDMNPYAVLGGVRGWGKGYIWMLHRVGRVLCELRQKDVFLNSCPASLDPMHRLLMDGRSEDIPQVWADADEIRLGETVNSHGGSKPAPKRINARHTRKAVKNLLGGDVSKGSAPTTRRRRAAGGGASAGSGEPVGCPGGAKATDPPAPDEPEVYWADTLVRLLKDALILAEAHRGKTTDKLSRSIRRALSDAKDHAESDDRYLTFPDQVSPEAGVF